GTKGVGTTRRRGALATTRPGGCRRLDAAQWDLSQLQLLEISPARYPARAIQAIQRETSAQEAGAARSPPKRGPTSPPKNWDSFDMRSWRLRSSDEDRSGASSCRISCTDL